MHNRLVRLVIAFVLLAGCNSPEPYEPTPGGSGGEESYFPQLPTYTLLSGEPIASNLSGGVAPLSLDYCYSHVVVGAVYETSPHYPDLFVCGTGGLSSRYGGRLGLSYYEFSKVMEDGRLLYNQSYMIYEAPWEVDSAGVRILKIGNTIYGVKITKTRIYVAEYDRENRSFGSAWKYENKLTGLPYALSTFDIAVSKDGSYADLSLIAYTVSSQTPESDYETDSFYDSSGAWLGTFPEGAVFRTKIELAGWTQMEDIVQVSREDCAIINPTSITLARGSGWNGYIMSNKAGVLKYLPWSPTDVADYLVGTDGEQLLNRSNVKTVLAVNRDRDGNYDDFLTSGEGATYLYRYAGYQNSYGTPVYEPAEMVMMSEGDLYSGSLTVPSVVDWDGDGALDIVTGNSEGRLIFFKNRGTNSDPCFGEGEYMMLGDKEFCVRAGYYELQGPMEACWGYLCPTVFDWDGDGLLDIVFSYNEGKYMYMRNIGTATNPVLDTPQTIYQDGMELYGVWRVRPAIARVEGRVMMMIQDGENALHLYWQTSPTSVTDGGKVLLTDGKHITGHNNREETVVQYGRGKLNFVDWDCDGDLDLLVGTVKRHSFPSPERGLPESRRKIGHTGMQVLLFLNEGTSAEPRYAYPEQFLVNGVDRALGAHSNAPVGCMLGDTSEGPNLVVGVESGRFMFFHRSELSTVPIP